MACRALAAPAVAALVTLAAAAPPEIPQEALDRTLFKHVSHLGWVVRDLDRVTAYWEKLGLKDIRRTGVADFAELRWRGRAAPTKLKKASVAVGNVTIEWIQPITSENAYSEFLDRHGDGIHHLAYSVPTEARWREQIAWFGARGVELVQEGRWAGQNGGGRFAYLDTAPRGGGVTVELEYNPDLSGLPSLPPSTQDYPFTRITQYAFIVRDLQKVSDFYQSIGLGPFPFDRMISTERMYRGKPVPFEMYLGWGRHGDVPFEWIQPLVGPSVYDEYLEAHGEGFHHIAFNVRDIDQAIALMKERGADVTQSGGWDFPTSKGRFAYLDTERFGGVTTELLWNKP